MIRSLITVILSLFLAACASKPVESVLKPTIRSIAIVPTTDPASYMIQNASSIQWVIPITSAGYALDNRAKAKLFTERLTATATKFAPGRQFTYVMAEALRSHGYSVQILDNVRTYAKAMRSEGFLSS